MSAVSRQGDDDRLLAELGEAVRAASEVPASFIATGKAAFAWRNVDAELAALSYDSATSAAELAGTRADRATLRTLTFVASLLTIELEVTPDALLGQVVPPQPGEIEVQARDGQRRTTSVDEVGWFTFRPGPAGLCRMLLRTGSGDTVLTEWVAFYP